MRQRRGGRARRRMGGRPYRAVRHMVVRTAERVWHDLQFRELYRSGKEFELMHRALGFAALAILTVIPLLIVIAAANPAPRRGFALWVIYGMGLTGSSADAVTRLLSAPARVLGTTSVFSILLLGFAGVAFAGSVQGGFERILGLPVGPWHKIWRQAVWAVVLIAYIYVQAVVGTVTHAGLAETAGRAAVSVVLGIAFFWWGLRFLVGGRVSYLAAMPGAVATIVGLGGLRGFSGLVFQPLIASNAVTYGALGTVLIVQSWLIGVGWVVYGGQLFGRWFNDAWMRAWAERHWGHEEPDGEKEGEHPVGRQKPGGLPPWSQVPQMSSAVSITSTIVATPSMPCAITMGTGRCRSGGTSSPRLWPCANVACARYTRIQRQPRASPRRATAARVSTAAPASRFASRATYSYHRASPTTASNPCAPTTVRGRRVAETDSSYSMSQMVARASPARTAASQVSRAANAMGTSHPRQGTTLERCRIHSGEGSGSTTEYGPASRGGSGPCALGKPARVR